MSDEFCLIARTGVVSKLTQLAQWHALHLFSAYDKKRYRKNGQSNIVRMITNFDMELFTLHDEFDSV